MLPLRMKEVTTWLSLAGGVAQNSPELWLTVARNRGFLEPV